MSKVCSQCDKPIWENQPCVTLVSHEWSGIKLFVHSFHKLVKLSEIRKWFYAESDDESRLERNWFDKTYRFHPEGEEERVVEFLARHVPEDHEVAILVGKKGFLAAYCQDCEERYDTEVDPVA